jgi:hypothetical protein
MRAKSAFAVNFQPPSLPVQTFSLSFQSLAGPVRSRLA